MKLLNSYQTKYILHMKRLFIILILFASSQFLVAAPGPGNDSKKADTELTEAQKERAVEMQTRLDEIKSMDFKSMSKTEKKDVRKELRDMKEEAKRANNGIYLSVGAIIVILLILILVT